MTQAFRSACVIGWPVAHSRSPMIHNYWIRKHGIAGEYRLQAVATGDFSAFAAALAAHGYVGANVTIPHKEAAMAVSQPDDRARAVGAANTLWLDGANLRSTNTDVEGFLDNLDASAPGWDRELESVMVLGAGGAARAVVYGLIGRGVETIHLANRTPERAHALRERFGPAVRVVDWGEVENRLAGAGLFVNTTSLGMHGQPPLTVGIDRLPAQAVVADLVYAPLETELLAAARRRDLRVADGLGMLLYQAVRAFSLFFGVRPEVTAELRAMVEADLRAQK